MAKNSTLSILRPTLSSSSSATSPSIFGSTSTISHESNPKLVPASDGPTDGETFDSAQDVQDRPRIVKIEPPSGDAGDDFTSSPATHPRPRFVSNLRNSSIGKRASRYAFAVSDASGNFFTRVRAVVARKTLWMSKNFTWIKAKPVLRCAIVAWLLVLFFVHRSIQTFLGQVSYLLLIAPYLAPPSGPFLSVLEQQALILVFVSVASAWSSLGSYLAWLARKERNPGASTIEVVSGRYIEAVPTIIISVFIFSGTAFFLFVKANKGFAYFAYVFSACICVDVSLVLAAWTPYPIFKLTWSIALAYAINAVLSVLGSLFIFPQTISSQFRHRARDILIPLSKSLSLHQELLKAGSVIQPHGQPSDFTSFANSIQDITKQCESGLAPLAASARLLKGDLIYGRFSPDEDLLPFRDLVRSIVGRAHGLGTYPNLVDPSRNGIGTTSNSMHNLHTVTSRSGISTPALTHVPSHTSPPATPKGAHSELPPTQHAQNHSASWRHSALSPSETGGAKAEEAQSPGPGSPAGGVVLSLPSTSTVTSNNKANSPPPLSSPRSRSGHSTPTSPLPGRHPLARSHSGNISIYRSSNTNGSQDSSGLRSPNHGHHHHHHPRDRDYHHSNHHHHHNHNHHGVYSLRHHHHILHSSLLSLAKARAKKREHAVGLFVSQRYFDLESARLLDPRAQEYVAQATALLQKSCDDTLAASAKGLTGVIEWLTGMHAGRFKWWIKREEKEKRRLEKLEEYRDMRLSLAISFEDFRNGTRHIVADPYRAAFDEPSPHEGESELQIPPHRYLFNCYVYQYHLIQICEIILQMLDWIIEKEEERYENKLWTPVRSLRWWSWSTGTAVEDPYSSEDDPDFIEQEDEMDERRFAFGKPNRRDPDALPPSNTFEWILNLISRFFSSLVHPNVLFGVKAGVFIVALSLPAMLKPTVPWAFRYRYSWAIFMAQMTLARFRGDTAFELVARLLSTFGGCVTGLAIWYMSSGTGPGNPFGLAAVCLLFLPICFYVRLYCPIAQIANIIFFLTVFTVVGYSYQAQNVPPSISTGLGWSLAWKRFASVAIGVTSAFFISFLPPSTTIRRYSRNLLSTTSAQMGTIYASLISYANTKHSYHTTHITANLIALQAKLKRGLAVRGNVVYELSLRGRWPAERYQQIADLQLSISYSLSHLASVLENLEPDWAHAFLRRTRFADPDFQGDILSVISLISLSLRTGTPLPHINPCPLLDRFMLRYHGLNVSQKQDKDASDSENPAAQHGLPTPLSVATLQNEQYMMFCVGISTAFGIISRLDRLMIAAKEIVGEQYHMHGVRPVGATRNGGVEMGSRVSTVHFDPPRDV